MKNFFGIFLGLSLGLSIGLGATAIGAPNVDHLLKKFTLLAEIFEAIQNHYVDPPNSDDLIYGAADGILNSLDSHSDFLKPKAYEDLIQAAQGEHAGVGLELNFETSPPEVIAVVENSPAAFAGINTGDKILKIAQEDTRKLSYDNAKELIRGDVGTKLELLVQRRESEKPWSFTLIRNWIRSIHLEHEPLSDGIHYIKIKHFARGIGYDLRAKLKNQSKLRGLVLDLRDNPGGLFDEAVKVCDLFLNGGVIVSAIGRNGRVLNHQKAQSESIGDRLPISILINRATASAAEIVAGALQENNRAKLFGEKTYGKGSIQTILDLSDGSGIKLTVARYQTPKGKIIDGKGILPDVHIPNTHDDDIAFDAAYSWLKKRLL